MLISITSDKTAFLIRALDFDLHQLKGLRSYLKTINNGYRDNEEIFVPIENADSNVVFSKIKELFSAIYKCEIEIDRSSKSIVDEAEDEHRKFSVFSEKALQIRNNEVRQEELQKFIDTIKKEGFKRTLEPFQLLASYHLAFSQNACNFSVPGSGKTTTVLAAYEYLRNTMDIKKRVRNLLVVGPLSAFIAWKDEYFECFGYEPRVLEIRGGISKTKIEEVLLRSRVDEEIIIASYGSIDNKKDIINKFLRNNPTMVVLDEAHRIKNVEDGIQSNAALSLSNAAKSRVILTGTPAANSYIDLYNLYKFIWPSNEIIGYSIAQLATMSKIKDDSRVPDLINRISPFFIRIKKSDLGLPEPKFNKPNVIKMGKTQRLIYDAVAAMAVNTFQNKHISSIFRKSALIRLRQAATNPNLLNKPLDDYYDELEGDYFHKTPLKSRIDVDENVLSLIRNYKSTEIPSKFIQAKELANDLIAKGEKLLIWCEFVGNCSELAEYLFQNNINNKLLYGKTSQEEREKIIKEFHDKNSPVKVIIANPHAVGESISLHKACHNALYLEQGYNAGTYMQSKDRIHRVGLAANDVTNYFFLHSEDSVDELVYARVNEKEKRMLEIIEKEEIPLLANNADFQEDTEDDIKAIIRAYYEHRENNI